VEEARREARWDRSGLVGAFFGRRTCPRDGAVTGAGSARRMRGSSREVRWVLEKVGEGESARHPRGPFVARQRVRLCGTFVKLAAWKIRLTLRTSRPAPRRHEVLGVDEMSWRDTLFVWRGDMEYSENVIGKYRELLRAEGSASEDEPFEPSTWTFEPVTWKGRWVGVDAADATKADMPPVRDWRDGANGFDSDNRFNVIGHPPRGTWPGQHNITLSFRCSGNVVTNQETGKDEHIGWQLDNGDGPRWYGDAVHDVRSCGDDLVFARGHNQFAPFIAVGFLSGYRYRVGKEAWETLAECRRTLTVARRYLDDGDERCGWSTDDLERKVRAGMASGVPKHPWMVECMGSAKRNKRKR